MRTDCALGHAAEKQPLHPHLPKRSRLPAGRGGDPFPSGPAWRAALLAAFVAKPVSSCRSCRACRSPPAGPLRLGCGACPPQLVGRRRPARRPGAGQARVL